LADSTDPPEFTVTGADGKIIATFTITADAQVTSDSEMVTDMVTSMIKTREWTAGQATRGLSDGWSNGYVSISCRPR
jgi:hypothetical protein